MILKLRLYRIFWFVLNINYNIIGYILVVDEADKAPTYVTAVLRNLLEEMVLASASFKAIKEECIVIHRNFRMIVLANRPG